MEWSLTRLGESCMSVILTYVRKKTFQSTSIMEACFFFFTSWTWNKSVMNTNATLQRVSRPVLITFSLAQQWNVDLRVESTRHDPGNLVGWRILAVTWRRGDHWHCTVKSDADTALPACCMITMLVLAMSCPYNQKRCKKLFIFF